MCGGARFEESLKMLNAEVVDRNKSAWSISILHWQHLWLNKPEIACVLDWNELTLISTIWTFESRSYHFDVGQDSTVLTLVRIIVSRPHCPDSGPDRIVVTLVKARLPSLDFWVPAYIMYCMLMCIQQQLNTYVWIVFKLSYYLLAISLFAYLFLFLYLLL